MHGTEETKAFCSNCEELTLHKYSHFSYIKPTKPKIGGFLISFLESFVRQWLGSNEPTGDYKCTKCGTYLRTPDAFK